MDRFDVVIVGAGHAGVQAAVALRQFGYEGSVALVSDEEHWPYERPSLSKEYLSGHKSADALAFKQIGYWTEKAITLLRGTRVDSVEADSHAIALRGGATLSYGTLIWSAGGAARRLSCEGGSLGGVHTVRTLSDVDLMRRDLDGTETVTVIGGGYIGLETAAVLRGLGKRVTLLEAQDRVLARVAGEAISRFYEAEHRRRGVDIRLGVNVACIEGYAGRASGVRLDDGTCLASDMVIVGIGIVPAVQPLLRAGARGSNGVSVDRHCRTSLTDVYAIGDCAAHANGFAAGQEVRVESVQNAVDQAVVAAKSIVGDAVAYDAIPWFWSNQYDLKLQTIGLSNGHDHWVVRGDPDSRSFSVVYLRDGRVVALDCVNAVKDYVQGKSLVAQGLAIDPVDLMDTSRTLKSMATARADA